MSSHVFDKKRWQTQSLFWQMGNIGSEVGRALNAKQAGNKADMKTAFYRGLDLIDATAEELLAQKSPRLKEVLRAREEFSAAVLTDKNDTKLEEYFMNFAIAQRMRQLK